MSIGTGLGLVFGLLLFDQLAPGLPIGFMLGIGIGAGLDEDARKKDKVI
ncbi:glycine zipper family protein [Pontibacillus yanchengensis]|uniref:Glycine zipper family protein n=2 Tax=Pontibacillus yanchengensis TaxID=462910 RepID=A0ACC7VCD4_9BACI|nr:glycine zipper family protein [Pontibacillus yanchengensis]MYL52628.1 glycine zipper family protein [Pontibacillus yanchengensis]